jgi:pantetheine-phosphate adenylyltransferase
MDIAQRTAALFDKLIVAIYDRPSKFLLFSTEERVALAKAVFEGWDNVEICSYTGLTVDLAKSLGAHTLVRGLRVISDFELEYQMALTNQQLCPDVDTICLMTRQDYAFISSSVTKEVFMAGGDVSRMVHPVVKDALTRKRTHLGLNSDDVPLVSLAD